VLTCPESESTATFLSWDDWGGFYAHVVPPQVDKNGNDLRAPELVISTTLFCEEDYKSA
jgi:phospholipase C